MASPHTYRRRLAEERDAAAVYRALASRREGEEREVLLGLARGEERHAAHWAALLDGAADPPHRLGLRARLLSFLARRVGSLLVLALVQRAELRDARDAEADDSPRRIAADERVHALVVAGLARRRRAGASGTFRAAVFGANDGLISNLSLVLGVAGAGVGSGMVLLTGVAGLLAGALSMAAGEYVSVGSQRDLVEGGVPSLDAAALAALRGTDATELALAFRAEGVGQAEALRRAERLLGEVEGADPGADPVPDDAVDVIGSAGAAAGSSFVAFAAGAVVPILPFLVAGGRAALIAGVVLAALALFGLGAAAAVVSGGPVLGRGLRQLLIGGVAAAVTYGLGFVLGVSLA